MGHLRINPTSGRLLKHPTSGRLINGCPRAFARWELIPCDGICICGECPGLVPCHYEVTITGFQACIGCLINNNPPPTLTRFESLSTVINSPFVVSETIPCQWVNLNVGSQTDRQWTDPECTGTPGAPSVTALSSKLIRLADNKFRFFIQIGGIVDIFQSADTFVATCTESFNLTNVFTACAIDSPYGHSGTASFVPGSTTSCPGTGSIYTSSDLAAVEGKVIKWAGICFTVVRNTTTNYPDSNIEGYDTYDTCAECCTA